MSSGQRLAAEVRALARRPWAGHVDYAAATSRVAMLVKTLAQELAPQRIRVNGISPGAIRTAINREAWRTPEAARKLLGLIPYGRIGDPDDVARAAVWLASDHSDYTTGTMLYVDGGMTLYPAFREAASVVWRKPGRMNQAGGRILRGGVNIARVAGL